MSAVVYRPSWGKMASSKGRRPARFLFSLIVTFTVLQICQSFVPRVLRTTEYAPHTEVTSSLRVQQQLTQIDPVKNNEGGDIEIEKTLPNANSTDSFGTLHPRTSGVQEYVKDIFPRAVPSLKLSKRMIQSTVDDMLKPSGRPSIGLFGDTSIDEESKDFIFEEGPVLATSLRKSSSVVARAATPMDDLQIANLRLSVFSNFNPESRKLFCERSCQLLSSRRRRGATCVIANIQKKPSDKQKPKRKTKPKTRAMRRKENGPIVGTAEVSSHEFSETKLGLSRPRDSILYVTEVAVDTAQRRKGIANLMMEAIDALANTRKIETIYLHVDVTNLGAVNLYQRAGYRKLEPDDPIYLEFTTKLNLHDGATRGRNHYLMAKDLKQPTWFQIREEQQYVDEVCTAKSQQRSIGIDVMSTF